MKCKINIIKIMKIVSLLTTIFVVSLSLLYINNGISKNKANHYLASDTNFIKVIMEVTGPGNANFPVKVTKDVNTYWTKTFKNYGNPTEYLFIDMPLNGDYYLSEILPINYSYTVDYGTDGVNYSPLSKTNGQYKFTIANDNQKIYLKIKNTYTNIGGFTASNSDSFNIAVYQYPTLKNIINNANYSSANYDYEVNVFVGSNPPNYVWYSGYMWRIMQLNNDGSVKMISDKPLTLLNYHNTSSSLSTSFMYKWLDELSESDPYDGVFYHSLNNPNNFIQPILQCAGTYNTDECNSNESVTDNIGLLRVSEYNNAGSDTSYLNISDYQWTMNTNGTDVRVITNSGSEADVASNNAYNVRPVIVLKNSVVVISGSGTSSSPYRLFGDNSATTNDALNTRFAGEYVSYSGKTWRIVGKNDNDTTKLILNASDSNRAFDTTASISQIYNPPESLNIGYYLNNTFYDSLTNKEYIADGTWYLGPWERNANYKVTVTNSTGSYAPVTSKVGLIRIGELFSGNDLDDNSTLWRTITPKVAGTFGGQTYTTEHTNVINDTGTLGMSTESIGTYATVAIRPVINLNANICITSGNGMPTSPYNIELCS